MGPADINDIIASTASTTRRPPRSATSSTTTAARDGDHGAKASNLEKGPKKVWAIGSKDAKIQNLTMDTNFAGILGYMELLKQSMHEMTGMPEGRSAQMQPISNTCGMALRCSTSR